MSAPDAPRPGLAGTPTMIIDDRWISGARGTAAVEEAILEELAEAAEGQFSRK